LGMPRRGQPGLHLTVELIRGHARRDAATTARFSLRPP
jgi:hypothetical protein